MGVFLLLNRSSGYTRQKTEQQAEEDLAESVDHDASGFGV